MKSLRPRQSVYEFTAPREPARKRSRWSQLIGDPESFSLEERGVNAFTLLITGLSAMTIPINIALGLWWPDQVLSIVAILLFGSLYWLFRIKRRLRFLGVPALVLSSSILIFVWLGTGGTFGPSPLYIPLLTIVPGLVPQRRQRLAIAGYFLCMIIGLFLWEWSYPEVFNSAYEHPTSRLVDIAVVTLISFIILSTVISSLLTSYRQSLRAQRKERERADQLLGAIFPQHFIEEMKTGEKRIAHQVPNATVLFADLAGFTRASVEHPPDVVIDRLAKIFSLMDAACDDFGVTPVKTIGDGYMAVAGIDGDDAHALQITQAARKMLTLTAPFLADWDLQLRIGIHSGPVIAGVLGVARPSFDLWGDTVNVASRLESTGLPDRVNASEATRTLLEGDFPWEKRGTIHLKGRGDMVVWVLEP